MLNKDGLIIQWGYNSGGSSSGTVVFPTPFSADAKVTGTSAYAYGDGPWGVNITSTNTTSFNFYQVHSVRFWWIAVGY